MLDDKTIVGSPSTVQTVAYTSSAASSNAVGSGVRIVRLVATTDCFFKIGGIVTATTSDEFLPAYTIEYRTVGNGAKVSVIRSSADGSLYMSEFNA